jgi:hypothetical protein
MANPPATKVLRLIMMLRAKHRAGARSSVQLDSTAAAFTLTEWPLAGRTAATGELLYISGRGLVTQAGNSEKA